MLIGLLGVEQTATAEPATPPSATAESVALWPPLCGGDRFWLTPFVDSLRVELAGQGLGCCELMAAGKTPSPSANVHVRVELVPCAADADRLHVSVSEPARAATAEREVSLADVTETARPRALALAVAELMRAHGQVLPRVRTEESPAVTKVTPPAIPPRPTRSAKLSVHVDVEARGFPTRDTFLWGGRAGLTAGWRTFHVGLHAGGGFASARVESGDVLLRTWSAGLDVGPRFATRAAIVDLGLCAELGWVWVRGESSEVGVHEGAGSDLYATTGLALSVQAPARWVVRPHARLAGGGVLRGTRAEAYGATVAGITGYYVSGALGATISP
jgi:hypothetical protein